MATLRERYEKLMNADPTIGQGPVIEWASWWDETIDFWEAEGMPKGMDGHALFRYFGLDDHSQFWFPTIKPGCPTRDNGCVVPGYIEDEADYDRLRDWFLPMDAVERMMDAILEAKPRADRGETIVWYTLEGFFWFPRVLFGNENHFYSFYDYPELYHRICEDLLAWQIRQVRELDKYIHADFMTIAEDMSYNHGSMISKDLFDEFMKPYYERLIAEVKKHGTRVFVDSDGKVDDLIPWFIECGVEGILPLEHQAGVDLVEYRKKFPTFMFAGGFDKMPLMKNKEDIRAEFMRLLPVVQSGRFMIGVDHQTPPGTTMDNYRYYVELLKKYNTRACKGDFKWAIIGAGGIAGHFVDAVKMIPGAVVAAVASKSAERAAAFAEKHGIEKSYGSYAEMLEEVRPDCVYIATTPNFHYENARLCLEHGFPFLCEKAAFLTEAQAAELFRLSEEKNLFAMEALWTRFLPTLKTAREWLDGGRIGTPVSFRSNVGGVFDREKAKRNFDPALAGGAMYDLTCYSYEIADYFFDEPAVIDDVSVIWEDTGIDLTTDVKLHFGDVPGTLLNSCDMELPEDLEIIGTEGRIVIPHPHYGNDAYLYDAAGNEVTHFHADVENGFVYEICESMACVIEDACESRTVPHALTERCAALFDRLNATKQ